MTKIAATPVRLGLLGFAAVLLIAWFCYRPAISGDFTLDDIAHFQGLATVEDFSSGIDYILTGSNGPTGRPIAMMTFAMQAAEFADGAQAFLQVNVIIHLANGMLLLWFLYELASACGLARERAMLVAIAASGVWLLLALNATATMLVVQRMTTLSASFTLAGLAAYLFARRRSASHTRFPLAPMTAVVAVATIAATLTKETGLLLPLFVLVLESTVLSRPEHIAASLWKRWLIVVLALPGIAIVAYLASRVVYPDWMVARRGFDGWERLLMEAQLLWVYLGKALAGLPGRLGIYQSDMALLRSPFEPVALLSLLAWLLLGAYAIWRRRQHPLLAFAILWFLAGHLLESTVLPLELYFEHRNYVPLIGPIFAACAWLLGLPRRAARFSLVGIGLFALMNAGMLYVFASMWGEPSTSARYWAYRYPDSVRAVSNLATYQLAEEGPQRTINTIRQFVALHPEHGYLRAQELNLLCLIGATDDLAPVVSDLESSLQSVGFTYAAGNMLSDLFSTTTQVDCPVTTVDVRRFAAALRNNPRYVQDPYYNQFHHKLLAGIARFEGDMAGALAHLETAMSFWATPELNTMMVIALVAERDFARAEAFIDEALLGAPANPLKAVAWRRDLEGLRQYVLEVAKHAADGQHDEVSQ